jgi:hypothetical protein
VGMGYRPVVDIYLHWNSGRDLGCCLSVKANPSDVETKGGVSLSVNHMGALNSRRGGRLSTP